jgi:hypothetical protein
MSSGFTVVLTMGRVGSTSIQRSIESSLAQRVLHVHSITPRLLAKQVAKKGGLDDAPRSALDGLETVAELARRPGRVKVVTLVREPLSRAHSAAFAVLRTQHTDPDGLAEFLNDEGRFAAWWGGFKDQRPLVWFDQEIKGMLGIDVFERPFPERGWDSFRSDRCDLLVMRSEIDDDAKSTALGDFLETGEIPIQRENFQSRSNAYAPLYDRFRQQAVIADGYRSLLLDSQYNRHFYDG